MKKLFITLGVLALAIGLHVNSATAQVVVGGGAGQNGGDDSVEIPPIWPEGAQFEFKVASTSTVWRAGSTQGIKYNAVNLVDFRTITRLSNIDPYYGGTWQMSYSRIAQDGIHTDAFKVPFGMPSGTYNLTVSLQNPYYWWESMTFTNPEPIVVTSSVLFPRKNNVLKAGKSYTMDWAGADITRDYFTVYIQSMNDGSYRRLGTVAVRRGKVRLKIPTNLPPGQYTLAFRSWYSSSVTSESFRVTNAKWHGNPGPENGSGSGKG